MIYWLKIVKILVMSKMYTKDRITAWPWCWKWNWTCSACIVEEPYGILAKTWWISVPVIGEPCCHHHLSTCKLLGLSGHLELKLKRGKRVKRDKPVAKPTTFLPPICFNCGEVWCWQEGGWQGQRWRHTSHCVLGHLEYYLQPGRIVVLTWVWICYDKEKKD